MYIYYVPDPETTKANVIVPTLKELTVQEEERFTGNKITLQYDHAHQQRNRHRSRKEVIINLLKSVPASQRRQIFVQLGRIRYVIPQKVEEKDTGRKARGKRYSKNRKEHEQNKHRVVNLHVVFV